MIGTDTLDTLYTRPGDLCVVGRALAALAGDPDFGLLSAAMDDRRHPARSLVKVLTLNGFPVGITAVRVHRRGECSCGG